MLDTAAADRSVGAPAQARLLIARGTEVLFLLLVCGAVFFVGLGRFDFIKTEGLRAIVVAEMLEPLRAAEALRAAEPLRWTDVAGDRHCWIGATSAEP